ncbi:uncharacterized protein LOC113502013 isoform X2 [Trichoplusia ni]|uniref:Uncharacterized protein LOC113502013 isoform X2 n=1 Tax=Trichoplusia ni TaxID=7111 RepID=A0A7E5WGB2_TRINI|nr:uncharacterized protein LOC113502013 isoform X2 [Trichoplusia ni]
MEFCGGPRIIHKSSDFEKTQFDKECPDCSETSEPPVCGIRQDGEGYRLRTFRNKCELTKHNCVKGTHFFVTEFYLCNDDKPAAYDNDVTQKEGPAKEAQTIEKLKKIKPLVIVSGSMIDKNNINESIDNFFASTHLVNMPLKQQFLNESTRKVFASILGPRVIFTPWTTKPKNVSTDYLHMPLVKTCFHKCPTKCPDTYAPVCGVPGANTNYPSVVFKNHCFMDVAQCKIVTEELSSSVHTAGETEPVEVPFETS